jgi:ankyrin repeat protein
VEEKNYFVVDTTGESHRSAGKSQSKSKLANSNDGSYTQLVELLLRTSRVNVNSQDAQKRTPLIHAITVNDWQTVERLLKIEDIDLHLPDDTGRTAVFHTAQTGDLHII